MPESDISNDIDDIGDATLFLLFLVCPSDDIAIIDRRAFPIYG